MRQIAPVGAGFLAAASLLCAADAQPRKAQVEPMSQVHDGIEEHLPPFDPDS